MPNRQTKPYFLLNIISCLQSNKRYNARASQLEIALTKSVDRKIDKDKASKIIESFVEDGILIPDSKDSGTLHIGNDGAVKTYNQDLYCFECFLPGELVKCRDCTRAFHQRCARRHPERPNYVMQKSNQIAEYDDDDEDVLNRIQLNSDARTRPCHVVLERTQLNSDHQNETNELNDETNDQNEEMIEANIEVKEQSQTSEDKPDIVCIGEVRPPTRQRNITENNSMKCESEADESLNMDQINYEKELCTFCRLIKAGQNVQPPNLDAVEMCHLLKYTFKRNRAWIKHDIYKKFENMKLTKKSTALLIQNLFQNRPLMTLDSIQEKIKYNKYNLLNELLADITEFQYSLGVLFGSAHVDFDCSKYIFRDIQYDIKEIRRCPDCYRHSSDRLTPYWFALPCLQRHELVFAKCKGHAYWPAKVVRVLQKADKYDVRFFGGNHERAVVDKNYIRPIDAADISKSKSAPFKKAMNELMCYQSLEANSSLDKFSFYSANKIEINNTIKALMSAIDANSNIGQRITKRRRTIAASKITDIDVLPRSSAFFYEENSSNFESNFSEPRTPTPKRRYEPNAAASLPAKRTRRAVEYNVATSSPTTTTSVPILIDLSSPPTNAHSTALSNISDEMLATLRSEYDNLKRRNECVEEEIENLKRRNECLEAELAIAKRKSYCFICLKQAEFVCCINASYCSKKCQGQHWIEGHKNFCSHRSTSSSATQKRKKSIK